eukprot:9481338-Pyramimonas_sp.AAC.1
MQPHERRKGDQVKESEEHQQEPYVGNVGPRPGVPAPKRPPTTRPDNYHRLTRGGYHGVGGLSEVIGVRAAGGYNEGGGWLQGGYHGVGGLSEVVGVRAAG